MKCGKVYSASLTVNILHSCCSSGLVIRQHCCDGLERISSIVSNIDVSVGSDESDVLLPIHLEHVKLF